MKLYMSDNLPDQCSTHDDLGTRRDLGDLQKKKRHIDENTNPGIPKHVMNQGSSLEG